MESPKEKKRYLSSMAILYALRIISLEHRAEIIMIRVDFGRWKLVIWASMLLKV